MKRMAIAQRGYCRNERERLILVDAGLPDEHLYLEGRGAESLDRIKMKPGELLATVGGLRALGDSRRDIVAAAQHIHKMGAAILDVMTGHRSDQHGVDMLDRALARLRGELVMPVGQAESMQAKSVRARIGKRMAMREAMKFWRDPRLTTGEAIKRMSGWSARTAYLRLGKRGLPSGRLGNMN